jgi:PTS system beta-glucosides-specific IIC component
MADNERIAAEVLDAVGGKDNITSIAHCMTRLRINLKDESVPDDDRIKAIKGVLGCQWSGGQYQVIIGQNVPKVYDAIVKLGVSAGGAIDENLDADGPKEPWSAKRVGQAILNYLSKTMVAAIPVMMGAAMFRTIAVIAGPGMLNAWAADSEIYNLFYNWIYDAGYYFMPVYLGYSAAQQLGCSKMLGMMMGGILIAPDFVNIVTAVADAGQAFTSVYGIPAMLNTYSSTVLPILLCMPVLGQVEKLFKRITPTCSPPSSSPSSPCSSWSPSALWRLPRSALSSATPSAASCSPSATPAASPRSLRSRSSLPSGSSSS